MARKVRAADLFAGAGGTSTGMQHACDAVNARLELTAVNHWDRAIETHAANHPSARHFCEPVDALPPRRAVPGGKFDLLWASPECVHHSRARGGKPVNDQSRASAWCILRWAQDLSPDSILIENVEEFSTWGPLGSNGRPLKSWRSAPWSITPTSRPTPQRWPCVPPGGPRNCPDNWQGRPQLPTREPPAANREE